jgi:hypothetical protein
MSHREKARCRKQAQRSYPRHDQLKCCDCGCDKWWELERHHYLGILINKIVWVCCKCHNKREPRARDLRGRFARCVA